MNELNQFFTREAANEGIELPLSFPCGKSSGHAITLRGCDSDCFREAQRAFELEMVETPKEIMTNELYANGQLKVLASLVKSWTLDVECSIDNIVLLLREAPMIRDAINIKAAQRELYIKKK